MIAAPLPADEAARLTALRGHAILDTDPELGFDDLTALAASICDTPIALVSLVDAQRQWFKSRYGIDARETPREMAFCAHAILQSDILVVPDATLDPRFHDNPLATGAPCVRFYAGAPLIDPKGFALGTLCVIDHVARDLSARQLEQLARLGRQVICQLELRRARDEARSAAVAKDAFLASMSHEIRMALLQLPWREPRERVPHGRPWRAFARVQRGPALRPRPWHEQHELARAWQHAQQPVSPRSLSW